MQLADYVGARLFDYGTGANVGTSETVIGRIWLPPNFFQNYGDRAFVEAMFACAANTNVKTIKALFGSSTSSINGRIGTTADNNIQNVIRYCLIYLGGNSFRTISTLAAGGTGTVANKRNSYTADPTQPILLSITGQSAAASDDVTNAGFHVFRMPVGLVL